MLKNCGLNYVVMCIMLILALSVCAYALPSAVTESDCVNNYDSSAGFDVIDNDGIKKMPIVVESAGNSGEDGVLAAVEDNNTIIVSEVICDDILKSEDTFIVEIVFDNYSIYDSKYNLKLSVVDSNGSIVAKQSLCEYNYYYGSWLLYTMEVVDSAVLDPDEEYSLKFTYDGDYDLVIDTDYVSVCVTDEFRIVDGRIIDINDGTLAFYAANHDKNKDYAIGFERPNGELDIYNADNKDGDWLTVDVDDFKQYFDYEYDGYWGYAYFYEIVAGVEYKQLYVDSFWFDNNTTGKTFDNEFFFDINVDDTVSDKAETLSVSFWRKADGSAYTSSDKDNIDAYVVDTATSKKVGTLSSINIYDYNEESDEEFSEVYCRISFVQNLNPQHKYLLIVDDGDSIRMTNIYVEEGPNFDFCGFAMNKGGSYTSSSAKYGERIECAILGFYNMPVVSKITAEICEYSNGNKSVLYVIDEKSITVEYDNIYFSLIKNSDDEVLIDNWDYYFNVYYDGMEIHSTDMYFYDTEDYGSESYFDMWTGNEFLSKDAINVVTYIDYNGYNLSDIEFSLYDYDADEYINGDYIIIVDYQSEYYNYARLLLSFPYDVYSIADCDYYKRFQLEAVCDEDILSATNIYLYYYYAEEICDVYVYTVTESDGYTYIYATGLDDNSKYNLWYYDCYLNEEVKVALTKEKNKGILKVKTENIIGIEDFDDSYAYIEDDGIKVSEIYCYEFGETGKKYYSFYSEFSSQDNRYAILNLPSALYTHYRLADSKDALSSKSFSKIKNNVLYTLPDENGQHVIYAQFKDAKGNLSEVMWTEVNYVKPELSDIEAPVKVYYDYIEENDCYAVYCKLDLVSSHGGEIEVVFKNENGFVDRYGWFEVDEGENTLSYEGYIDSKIFERINYLSLVLYHDYDFSSQEYLIDMEFVPMYTEYELDDGFIAIDNLTKSVIYCETTQTNVQIPASVNGERITGISDGAFDYEFCPNLEGVVVPSSISYIDSCAFDYAPDVTLYVREGSYAHQYAEEMGMNYELVMYIIGDVNGDDEVDMNDAILLLQHSMFPSLYPLNYAGDVDFTDDGEIDMNDAILLLQHSMFPDLYPIA